MLAGLRIEAVVDYGVGGLQRGRSFDCRIADAHLAVVADAQFAMHLQRNSRKGLVRAHLSPWFYLPAALPGACVCFHAEETTGCAFWRITCNGRDHETPHSGVAGALLEIRRPRAAGARHPGFFFLIRSSGK